MQRGEVVAVTTHAIERFRRRLGGSPVELAAAIRDRARVQEDAPGWVNSLNPEADLWLVTPGWACPLRRPREDDREYGFDYLALTVLKRARPAKADVRAWREQAREAAA
jgi:hypothetical protein